MLTDVVAAFTSALLRPGSGRSVHCDLAESGSCGAFRYFTFRGDLNRDETQWFDQEGELIGVYSYSDQNAYCDGATRVLVQGDLPDCQSLERNEIHCGSGASPLPPPKALQYDILPIAERVRAAAHVDSKHPVKRSTARYGSPK